MIYVVGGSTILAGPSAGAMSNFKQRGFFIEGFPFPLVVYLKNKTRFDNLRDGLQSIQALSEI